MPYYVPVGLRGILLHAGTTLTGLFGSVAYWRACRRRRHLAFAPLPAADA